MYDDNTRVGHAVYFSTARMTSIHNKGVNYSAFSDAFFNKGAAFLSLIIVMYRRFHITSFCIDILALVCASSIHDDCIGADRKNLHIGVDNQKRFE